MTVAYPLQWPQHKPRTPSYDRVHGRFGKRRERFGIEPITLSQGCKRVRDELGKYGKRFYRVDMDGIVISTMLQVRKTDGMPRSGQRKPDDPGAAVYFDLDNKPRCIPCDKYIRLEDNIAAIAGAIECLRTLERYDTSMAEAAYTGFDALPPPDHIMSRSWRDVLNYYGNSLHECESNYKSARAKSHPDRGGDVNIFNDVQKAWEQAQVELGN